MKVKQVVYTKEGKEKREFFLVKMRFEELHYFQRDFT
jgi:hypothetical protein